MRNNKLIFTSVDIWYLNTHRFWNLDLGLSSWRVRSYQRVRRILASWSQFIDGVKFKMFLVSFPIFCLFLQRHISVGCLVFRVTDWNKCFQACFYLFRFPRQVHGFEEHTTKCCQCLEYLIQLYQKFRVLSFTFGFVYLRFNVMLNSFKVLKYNWNDFVLIGHCSKSQPSYALTSIVN